MTSQEDIPVEWQRQKDIIRELLNDQLTTETAATDLAAVTIPGPIRDIDNEEVENDIMADIERMFNFMLDALEKNPTRVPSIFNLIICISQLPPVYTISGRRLCATDPVQRVWEDLPSLGWSLNSEWNSKYFRLTLLRCERTN